MIYRTDVFERVRHRDPDHLAEYEAAAKKVRDAGGPLLRRPRCQRARADDGAPDPEGCDAIRYDPLVPKEITVNLNEQASKDVLNYSAGLVEQGLVGTQDQFTPSTSPVWSAATARPTSRQHGRLVTSPALVSARVRTRPLRCGSAAQCNPNDPVAIDWGGTAFFVTAQVRTSSSPARSHSASRRPGVASAGLD